MPGTYPFPFDLLRPRVCCVCGARVTVCVCLCGARVNVCVWVGGVVGGRAKSALVCDTLTLLRLGRLVVLCGRVVRGLLAIADVGVLVGRVVRVVGVVLRRIERAAHVFLELGE